MKCPFELPVRKEKLPRNTKNIDLYRIDRAYFPYTEEEADYIVQAINSHEKLLEALNKYGKHSTPEICCDASLKEGDKCTCGFEQALEAEKKE